MGWRAFYLSFHRAVWAWGTPLRGNHGRAMPSPDGVRIAVKGPDFKKFGFSAPKIATVRFFGGGDV